MNVLKIFYLMILVMSGLLHPVLANDNCTEGSEKCTLAIFPHSNFKQLLATYGSLLEDLNLTLDSNVKLVSSRSMSDFGYQINKGSFDIMLIGSGQFISTADPAGYLPLVSRNNRLEMSLFTKSDSEINSYQDLPGKRLGLMVQETTTWFATKILLQQNNLSLDSMIITNLGSQQACAHALAINKVDACVFAVSNLEIIQQQNVNIDFKSIGKILKLPMPLYAVHPSIDKEVIADIKGYFLSQDGFLSVTNESFDGFRQLILDLKQ